MARKPARRKEKEGDNQAAIVDFLIWNKIHIWVNKTTGTYDPVRRVFRKPQGKHAELSLYKFDLIGIAPDGMFIGVEVKATGKIPHWGRVLTKTEEGQLRNMERANKETPQALCFFADCLETVIEKFKERGYIK